MVAILTRFRISSADAKAVRNTTLAAHPQHESFALSPDLGPKAKKKTAPFQEPPIGEHKLNFYCTVTLTGVEAMPFATTTRLLAPVSAVLGTSNIVETILGPVAIPIVV